MKTAKSGSRGSPPEMFKIYDPKIHPSTKDLPLLQDMWRFSVLSCSATPCCFEETGKNFS